MKPIVRNPMAETERIIKAIDREHRLDTRRLEIVLDRNAADDSCALACARIRILTQQVARAKKRNDTLECRRLRSELKSAESERVKQEKVSWRLTMQIERLSEKLAAARKSREFDAAGR